MLTLDFESKDDIPDRASLLIMPVLTHIHRVSGKRVQRNEKMQKQTRDVDK